MSNLTNPWSMNQRYIEEHHVLTRYLADQLSDAERIAFESYYVEHSQVLQELELAAKLKLGLALMADSGELAAPARRPWLPGLAAAALLIAAVSTGFWLIRPAPAPLLVASVGELGGSQAAPLAADIYTIERTRSRRVDARIVLPPLPRTLTLRILPEHVSATYGLRLNMLGSDAVVREIAQLPALRADADGLVSVYLQSQRLAPGTYEIVLSSNAEPNAPVSSFVVLVEIASRTTP
jgi:hypothetical protein